MIYKLSTSNELLFYIDESKVYIHSLQDTTTPFSLKMTDMNTEFQDQTKKRVSNKLYAKKMRAKDIHDQLPPEIRNWQSCLLNPPYPFIFIDYIYYNVRKNGNIQDVLFFCIDRLADLKEAIGAAYSDVQIQRCFIHILHNSFKYISYSDLKKFPFDFKSVYHTFNESTMLSELENIKKAGKEIFLYDKQPGRYQFIFPVFELYPAYHVHNQYHIRPQLPIP